MNTLETIAFLMLIGSLNVVGLIFTCMGGHLLIDGDDSYDRAYGLAGILLFASLTMILDLVVFH